MSVYENSPDQRIDARTSLVSSQLIWNSGSLFDIAILLKEQQSPHSRSGKKTQTYLFLWWDFCKGDFSITIFRKEEKIQTEEKISFFYITVSWEGPRCFQLNLVKLYLLKQLTGRVIFNPRWSNRPRITSSISATTIFSESWRLGE